MKKIKEVKEKLQVKKKLSNIFCKYLINYSKYYKIGTCNKKELKKNK
jgi:hypothetical protein